MKIPLTRDTLPTKVEQAMKITEIKLHVLGRETDALVTSFEGLFEDSGPAGKIQYSLVRILTDAEIEGHYIVWSEVATGRPNALAEVLRQSGKSA